MYKHGMYGTRTYKNWFSMKQRCLNRNDKNYKNYGGRGITICPEWLTFINFYKDMGEKPKDKSIDRINNNSGYCKSNCRWATPKEQMNNTRRNHLIDYRNKIQTMKQWSEELGIKYVTLQTRIRKGWKLERALTSK